jgi:hypothetical protein
MAGVALGETGAIATDDHEGLADILRAYGRSRDLDAARIIISFASSERAQVRQAARQAVVMLGDAAIWQLREAFENTVGERPPRDWSWQRTARELFGRFDRLRLARVAKIFDGGRKARKEGDLETMRQAYDKVLARSPRFEHAGLMVPGYVDYARKADAEHRSQAIDAARRALRLNDDPSVEPAIQSLLFTLRAEAEAARGLADQQLLQRAIELDGGNDRARALLDSLERDMTERQNLWRRYGGAGAAGLVGILAIVFVLLRRSRTEPAPHPAAALGEAEPESASPRVADTPNAARVEGVDSSGAPDTPSESGTD